MKKISNRLALKMANAILDVHWITVSRGVENHTNYCSFCGVRYAHNKRGIYTCKHAKDCVTRDAKRIVANANKDKNDQV